MPPQLVALSEGPSILLDKPILLFGRNPECDIQIDSRKISRRHCCLAQVNDYLVIRDLGSTNGIRINGVRVLEGKLRGGDELTIGSHRYQIRWDPLAETGGPRPPKVHKPELAPPRPAGGPTPSTEDELLEECDEPVPLVEPGEVGTARTGAPKRSPQGPLVMPNLSLDATDDPALHENPLYIPEEVGLAPVSDVQPPVQKPPKRPEPTSLD
jgi:predicted component of type VI protein secretion system